MFITQECNEYLDSLLIEIITKSRQVTDIAVVIEKSETVQDLKARCTEIKGLLVAQRNAVLLYESKVSSLHRLFKKAFKG